MAELDVLKALAADHFRCAANQVSAVDLTSRHPWLRKHRLYFVADHRNQQFLIVAGEPAGRLVFDPAGDRPAKLEKLNRLFHAEAVTLPDGPTPEQLAWVLRACLVGPGGFVGSSAFWEAQKDALKLWTSPCPEDGPGLFRKYCQGPHLARRGIYWTLSFQYFTKEGGVERWHTSGDGQRVGHATFEQAEPAGRFFFPYA